MDVVVRDQVGFDGPKRAQTHVESHFDRLDLALLDRLENFGREMQTGGGSGDRHLFGAVGIHGLITLQVGSLVFRIRRTINVRRERHSAQTVGDGRDSLAGRVSGELHQSGAVR